MIIDSFTGLPDTGRARDERLEAEIDALFARMEGASEADSKDLTTQLAVLVRRRSAFMVLFTEIRWRARVKHA